MRMLEVLRAKANKAHERMEALAALAQTEARDLTAEEQTEFDAARNTVDKCATDIAALEKTAGNVATIAKAGATASATPAVIAAVTGRATVPAEPARKMSIQERLGVAAWAVAKQKHYNSKTALQHLEEAGYQALADESRATTAYLNQTKALTSITVGGGDNVIDTPLSTEFIETLRNESAFLNGGPLEVDMSMGSLKISGGNVGATGTYTAEGSDAGYTQMSTRAVNMQAKHLSAVTAIGNYLIDVSPLAVASIVGDDLQMGLTLAIDSAGLRGDGTGNNPAGILSLVNASHKFAATATSTTPTFAQVDADLRAMLTKARASNIPVRRRAWRMSSRVFTYLQFMRDANGNYYFPGLQLDNPTLLNYPVGMSEQIPSNLGVGTNESEIYLIDFGHVLMGITRALRLKASQEASYKNAGGTLVSAFSLDETVIRGTASHDFDMRHDKAAVVLHTVKWGG